MPVNLKDVADKVGVSISTVSRALNNDPVKKVKPVTRKRILAVARELGYVFEDEQASVSTYDGDTLDKIGIILATPDKTFAHPFFAESLGYLENEITRLGYQVGYTLTECAMGKERLHNIITNVAVSGIVLLGRPDPDFVDFLNKINKNLVYTGVNYINKQVDEIYCDGYDVVKNLYEHLRRVGHQQIAYIGPTTDRTFPKLGHQRYTAYCDCLNQYAVDQPSHYIQEAWDNTEDGYTAMYRMINSKPYPDAVICASDSTAIGALRAAFENHIRVPQDIAIAGIDHNKLSKYLVPSLTTVRVPQAELAKLAVNRLLEKINNKATGAIRMKIPCDLLIRESCGFHIAPNYHVQSVLDFQR